MIATTKNADDKFELTIKWEDSLATFGDSDTIESSAWSVLSGDITINDTESEVSGLPGHSHDDSNATVWCEGGTAGTKTVLKNIVTTAGGRELTELAELTVLDPIDPDMAGRYTTLADIYKIFGRSNVDTWIKIEDVQEGDNNARVDMFIAEAEDYVDGRLLGARYTIPFEEPIPRTIIQLAARLAGIKLYEARGADDATDGQHRYSTMRQQIEDELVMIRNGRLRLASDELQRHPEVITDDCD